MFKRFAIITVLFTMLLAGCASAAATQAPIYDSAGKGGFAAESAPSMEMPAAAPLAADRASGVTNSVPAATDRLVIRNASLTLVVADPGKSMDAIIRMAEEMTGFVVNSNLYKRTTSDGIETPEATITIRVPADKLNDALDQIKAQVKNPDTDIQSENVTGEDVTSQYTDLQSRLRNLEDAEAQLREIMASATKTDDVLNVFNQLTSIREQIEVLKGQIKYYEESAAMSAISVQLVAQDAVKPITIAGWQPVGIARDAVQALVKGLQFLVNVLIWLVIFFLPIFLLLYLPGRFLWKAIRKNRARKKAAAAQPETPNPAP